MERPPTHRTITIAVMGATGTGKSTFINLISGSNLLVSNTLRSVTAEVGLSNLFYLDGVPVTLVDTPGFDDSTMSDTEIFTKIASYLAVSFQFGFQLSGVIYLHRITDQRMTGSALKNYTMFKKLCGERGMPNVAIVTNMWGKVPQEVAEMRELQLRTEDIFFRGDMEKGAQMMRHDGSSLSAQKIIRHFVKMNPAVLQLQHEILVERKDVTQTDACAALDQGMHKLREKFRDDIQALKDEIEEALAEGGVNQQEELDKGIRGLENKLAEMDKARDELSNAFVAERAKVKPLIKELFRREQSRKGKGKASAQRPPPSTWKPNESQWNEIRSRLREQATEINTLKHQVQENKWETAGLAERLGDRPRIQHSASAGSINISGSELSGDQLLYLALFIVALMLSFMAFST